MDIKIVYRNPKDLIPAEYNPRKISAKQKTELRASLQRFGFVDPVLVNTHESRKNIIIGGHQRTQEAIEMGIELVPTVELSLSLEMEKELNVRMNKSGGEFDEDLLAKFFDSRSLIDWGFDAADFSAPEDEKLNEDYTKKVVAPVYEAKGEPPPVAVLCDTSKRDELLSVINASEIPDEDKIFLRLAAQRHIVFDYGNVAEYYCHAPKEVQSLMESSALVIIDFNKAIEDGFVRLSSGLSDVFTENAEGAADEE